MSLHNFQRVGDLSGQIELEPALYDIDPMNVVYHGNYVRYLELARSALLESYGYGYLQMQASGYLWPIVDMRLRYARPAVMGQRLCIRATITEWENRLRVDYLITDAVTGQKINTAHTIQVAVDASTQEMCFVCPAILRERLGVTS